MEDLPQGTGELTSEERTLGAIIHAGGLMTGFLVPLIIWLIKKDESPFIDDQGKEALNFQLTLIIVWILCFLLTCAGGIGFFLFPIVILLDLAFCIIGTVKAGGGEMFRYPLNMRMIP